MPLDKETNQRGPSKFSIQIISQSFWVFKK